MNVLMSLGPIVFRVPDLAYQRMQRAHDYRWVEHASADGPMAYQFTGLGSETLALDGYTLPDLPGYSDILADARAMAAAGEPQAMVDLNGDIYGLWVVRSVREDRSFIRRSNWPGRIDFTLDLTRYDH